MAVVVLALGGLASVPGARATNDDEARFVSLINELRAEKGLAALEVHPVLEAKAQAWARTMAEAGRIWHSDLKEGVTVAWQRLGENVGRGPGVDILHDAFVASPHHYDNLVDPRFGHVGLGVVWAGETLYVAEEFMTLRGADPAPPPTTAPAGPPITTASSPPPPTTSAAPSPPTTAAAPSPATRAPAPPPPTVPPTRPEATSTTTTTVPAGAASGDGTPGPGAPEAALQVVNSPSPVPASPSPLPGTALAAPIAHRDPSAEGGDPEDDGLPGLSGLLAVLLVGVVLIGRQLGLTLER